MSSFVVPAPMPQRELDRAQEIAAGDIAFDASFVRRLLAHVEWQDLEHAKLEERLESVSYDRDLLRDLRDPSPS